MSREELIEFLKNNLRLDINATDRLLSTEIVVRLKLNEETISEETFNIEKE